MDDANESITYVRTEPDIDSFTVSVTTALDRTTTIDSERFAGGGQHQVTTYPDGTELDVTTDADLSCTTITTEGTTIEIEAEVDPRFKTQSPLAGETTITTPDPNGPVVTMTNTRDVTLADPANPFSLLQLVDTQTVAGNIITRTYTDNNGKTIVTESSLGRERTQVLDTLGREVKTETLGLHPMRREFDGQGRISAIREGPDPDNSLTRVTTLAYKETQDNQNGLLDQITDAAGRTVSSEYDDAGRITEGTLPDGRVISVAYDANGNVTSITPPGRPAHEFGYTPINLEEKYEPPALDPMPTPAVPDPNTYFSYNLDGQMTQITRPDGGAIVYNYDTVGDTGQLVSKVLPSGQGSLSYAYHPATATSGAGLVDTITAPDGGTLTYSYLGNLPFQES